MVGQANSTVKDVKPWLPKSPQPGPGLQSGADLITVFGHSQDQLVADLPLEGLHDI